MTRIALISDIHFGKYSRTAEFSVPGEAIVDENTGGESLKNSMISLLKDNHINYLCIAGDLTSCGSPQEFSYCEELILDIAEKLGIPANNILLGLGNHDIDWNISGLYSKFDIDSPDFPEKLVKEKYRKIAATAALVNLESIPAPSNRGPAPFSGIIENDDFVVFLLNTGWCCTEEQAVSRGRLDENQLNWFRIEAARYKDSPKWKLILMHHHPFNYSYHVTSPDFSTLEEGSEFLDIAGKNGFHVVIHGHRHHPKAETDFKTGWNCPITFICAGSFAVNSCHRSGGSIPNTLHIIELTDEVGVLKLYNYQYSPARGWIPIETNSPETPLDAEMMFGKLFDAKVIEDTIQMFSKNEGVLRWCDLDECLKFLPVNELNNKISTQLAATHKRIGRFPDDVVLIKK